MITIAVRTDSITNMDMLPSLIKKTRAEADVPWGSVCLVIRNSDPSLCVVEQMFRTGVFAQMHWVPDDTMLFEDATHVIIQASQARADRLIGKLKKRKKGVRFKRI